MTQWTTGFNPEYSEDAPTIDQVRALPGEIVIEFGAPWCGHCRAAEPAVREIMAEHPDLPHIKIYDGKGKPLGRAFRVKLWPSVILLRDGEEVGRVIRPTRTEDLRTLFESR